MNPVETGVTVPDGWAAITYAKNQPPYIPLPTLQSSGPEGDVISRWRLTWRERFALLFGADLWLNVMTFGNTCRGCQRKNGLQPVRLWVARALTFKSEETHDC